MRLAFFLIVSILFIHESIASAEESWKLEKDKDGIKVWTRKTPNSQLKEYKVSTVINTTPEKLITFFKNVPQYDKWMFKAVPGSSKILKKINDNDFYTYLIISAPLIKSRESISHMIFKEPDSKGNIMINFEAAPNLIPLNQNYVRIPMMKAYFKIDPLENGKVQLTHQAFSSAGGTLPEFLVNMGAVDAPFYMFTRIKEIIQ
ncbi:MAG: hypothetical protein IPM95_04515 [Sphingobacteriales bacterium]|nr:hypothetical protein [Sphingobacteriales bacterium]